MPAPGRSIINQRVHDLHALLVEQGWAGRSLDRPDFDRILTRAFGLGHESNRSYVEAGTAHELWDTAPNRGPRPGTVTVRPAKLAKVVENGAPVQV